MLSRRQIRRSAFSGSLARYTFIWREIFAQPAWPTREIHAICGFPPGMGADVFVRFYAKLLQQDRSGKTILVENKLGAFGNISTEYLARSKPDDYTIGIMLRFLAALFKTLTSAEYVKLAKIETIQLKLAAAQEKSV